MWVGDSVVWIVVLVIFGNGMCDFRERVVGNVITLRV